MAEIVIVTGEGLVGHIHLDYLARSPRRRLYINGSEGSLEYDFITGKLEIFTAGDGLTQKKQYRTKRNILYRNQLQHFFDCVKCRQQPIVSCEDAIKTLKLAFESRKSFRC